MAGSLIAECMLRIAAALALLGFSGCAGDAPPPSGQPSFYRNLAEGGQLDPAAAQSMISGYRANNGLGAVTLDPALMKLAEEQSRAMVARDKLDHNVGKGFQQRINGYDAKVAVRTSPPDTTRWPRRSPAGAIPAAPRQHAQIRRDPHGHRGDLFAALEVQGVLDADPGGSGRQARLSPAAWSVGSASFTGA